MEMIFSKKYSFKEFTFYKNSTRVATCLEGGGGRGKTKRRKICKEKSLFGSNFGELSAKVGAHSPPN